MAVKGQNFKMWQGNHQFIPFVIKDMESLEGSHIKWAVSRTPDGEKLILKDSQVDEMTINGNKVEVLVKPQDTEGLSGGRYHHELYVEDVHGHKNTLAVGLVRLYKTLFD